MNKRVLIGTGVALLAFSVVRRGISASKARPKFLTPRNWKIQRWNLTFDLPFQILNIDSVAYQIQGLGGTLYYQSGNDNFEFASYYLNEPINVLPNTNNVYTVKCTAYLPDILSTLRVLLKYITQPLKFRAKGQLRMFGIGINYDETVTVTFIAEVINAIKNALSIFKPQSNE
ncbi:hypothetical protein [Emticicia sp. 17c]|uniref:hypothetical protein n=1 Tax=Emticicia sp. 17c TaxID=3127704 RepID=UPI00301BD36E